MVKEKSMGFLHTEQYGMSNLWWLSASAQKLCNSLLFNPDLSGARGGRSCVETQSWLPNAPHHPPLCLLRPQKDQDFSCIKGWLNYQQETPFCMCAYSVSCSGRRGAEKIRLILNVFSIVASDLTSPSHSGSTGKVLIVRMTLTDISELLAFL